MLTRQEIEKKEAIARDNEDGWVSEFIFALPMFFVSAAIWLSTLAGMHYIEMGTLF